jgi:hypothetical protein
VTPVLYPRMIEARFLDCGPNLFFGESSWGDRGGLYDDGGGGDVGWAVETQDFASLPSSYKPPPP